MLIVERQRRLLELLQQRRTAQLDELAQSLDVSPSTIRRDLEALEKTGEVKRTHGGAIFLGNNEQRPASLALAARMTEHVVAKQAIGRYAASLVKPNMTVILDGGSTVILTARYITARPVQLVTTSLSIAQLFRDDEQAEVILVGGSIYPRTEVTVGPIAISTLRGLHADLLLFSLAGIHNDAPADAPPCVGAYNINLDMAEIEQTMMEQSAKRVLLMDSGKFGRKSLVKTCDISDVDTVVTDDQIAEDWHAVMGAKLVAVDPDGQPL